MTDNSPPADASPGETAHYIALISKELRIMAAKSGMDFIAYLLSMAEDEAAQTARKVHLPPPGKIAPAKHID